MRRDFEALCPQSDAVRPNLSEIGVAIFEPLLEAFSGYVLPHRSDDSPTFKDEDCQLYVNKREWLARVQSNETIHEHRYEQLMEAVFWGIGPFSDSFPTRKLIFISGTIGSGKSTFTDYYLRCFCPTQSRGC